MPLEPLSRRPIATPRRARSTGKLSISSRPNQQCRMLWTRACGAGRPVEAGGDHSIYLARTRHLHIAATSIVKARFKCRSVSQIEMSYVSVGLPCMQRRRIEI